MARRVLFYVSGHGYGHARRTAQVIELLRLHDPDVDVRVRTTAPPRMFSPMLPPGSVSRCDVDAGAAERSTLEIDPAGTLDRIAATLARRDEIVATEVAAVGPWKPGLIVADVPFLAADVAEALGVPCVGMSNFTWDWIIEPFVARDPARRPLLDAVRASYAKMQTLLRLPLGGISDVFRHVIDVPLVANRSRRDPSEVRRLLGLDPKDDRRLVLFGIRGAIPTDILATAAKSMPDVNLLCPTNEPGDLPPGVVAVPVGSGTGGLDFSDVLQLCDVVVGKMGYGLVAECVVTGVALLWPRRTGFREDEVVEREGPRYLRMRELPIQDFRAGRWAEHVLVASRQIGPSDVTRSDGAAACAKFVDAAVTDV